jgi:signal transduction histidine kinase
MNIEVPALAADVVAALDEELARENGKLRKIVKALIDRVERSTDAQGNAFSLFQAAITLENTVRQRTVELQSLNRQLQEEIEERRGVEKALKQLKVQAERANLGKTEFRAAASHDLLQPLSSARLFIDALGERSLEPQSAAMLERIDQSLEAAERLLAALLEMSRIDAGALVPEIADVAIDPLLERLSHEYARAAEERHLRLRVVPCSAVVRTDLHLVERILRNFLGNALRYTQRGGILVGCRTRGSVLRVQVWDTGPGIPSDQLADVFKEFHRLDLREEHASGMGLGLAIVERLGRVLDAHIGVRSRLGRGSVFSIDLPLGDSERVRAEDPGQRRRRGTSLLVGKTVLLLDDDPAALRAMASQLRHWGLYTLETGSVRGAIAIVNAHGQLPHVMLIGGKPSDGAGSVEAIEVMRRRLDAHIPAVVLSSAANEARGISENGLWFLEQPVRIERLRSLLHHVFSVG